MTDVKAMRHSRTAQTEFFRNIGLNILYCACGTLITRGAVLGSMAPFGASYAAAVPKERLLPSLIGAAFGYVLLNPSDSFRYIAVIIAIGCARWLLSDIGRISASKLFAPLCAFIPTAATGIALSFGGVGTMATLTGGFIEAALAAVAAYFISYTMRLSFGKRSISAFTSQETACVVMSGCVLILSLGSLTIENISLGRIIAVIAVMLCARYGGVNGGTVSGAATGAVFSLAAFEQGFICGGYSFGGLMAGLFSPLGKIATALSFVAADFLMSLAFGGEKMPSGALIEGVIGAAVFMLLPKSVGDFISPVFNKERDLSLGETLRKNLIARLSFTSSVIKNVKNDVENVSEKMGEMYSPTFEWVCQNVADEVCSGCGLRMYCYEHKGGVTKDDFFRLEEELNRNGRIGAKEVGELFIKNCCKKSEIARSMTDNYKKLLSLQEAERRVSEIRSVVAGQFAGVSDILSDLSKEFAEIKTGDSQAADRIITELTTLGACPIECSCLEGENGRMSVELILSAKGKEIKRGQLTRIVSKCCGRRFDLPTVTCESGRLRAALCELPKFDVEIGSNQHIADNGKLCGDCIDYFNDGRGKTYALVCDGMGTGGRAAVDGNMAASVMGRLLRSGLSEDSALQIVNSALMIKSDDESLSTVDLAGVDLFTGTVTLKKAGAAATFIKKSGRVLKKDMSSLPAGILNNIKFAADAVNLTVGDMVVMVSDGAVSGDDKWLEKLIKTWNKGSTQELAQAVVEEAIKRRAESRDDDITALAMRITEN